MPALIRIMFLTGFWLIICSNSFVQAQKPETLTQNEKLELDIYRAATASNNQEYLSGYYRQRLELGEVAIRVFNWQLFAANLILAIVSIIAIAGIVLAGYQLWVSARIALLGAKRASRIDSKEIDNTMAKQLGSSVEVSVDKIHLQTSFVGVLLLAISGILLIVFIHEVYNVRTINLDASRAEQGAFDKPNH